MTNTHFLFASTISLCLSLSCTTEVGEQGPPGPAGSSPGSSPDCPDGYARDNTQTSIVLCRQGVDEVVKVGKKGSAFWIDRYEASIWDGADGTGKQYGATADDYPGSFPKNGQITTTLYAISKVGVAPSAYTTWFQANEACRASGKKLPNGDEWLYAARGTLDPGDSSGTSGACATNSLYGRMTGNGSKCVSDWGAQDMIGNFWEWTNEWFAGPGKVTDNSPATWPGPDYNGDVNYNIVSGASAGLVPGAIGLPAAAQRGGSWGSGTKGGTFSLNLNDSPAYSDSGSGFRCIIPR